MENFKIKNNEIHSFNFGYQLMIQEYDLQFTKGKISIYLLHN